MGKMNKPDAGAPLPEKVLLLYRAVTALIEEGADLAGMTVSDITGKAGIGKGTAYEYFDSKDEIIAGALLYFMEEAMAGIADRVRGESGLESRLRLMLDIMDDKAGEMTCVLRFLTLFFDASETGRLLREAVNEHKKENGCMPYRFGQEMIEQGIRAGEIREDKPVMYLTYVLISKLLAYQMFLLETHEKGGQVTRENAAAGKGRPAAEEFKKQVLAGILEEFQRK